jgi:tRNA nucleotidyltransferase (CCA-adding enzyme)
LRYPTALRQRVERIVRHHMFSIGKGDPLRARRFLAKYGDELASDLIDHKEADYRGKPGPDGGPPLEDIEKLDRFRRLLHRERRRPHRLADLAVNGKDLIEVGFTAGPRLGRVLRDLLHDVVDDPKLNTRAELLRRARRKKT